MVKEVDRAREACCALSHTLSLQCLVQKRHDHEFSRVLILKKGYRDYRFAQAVGKAKRYRGQRHRLCLPRV